MSSSVLTAQDHTFFEGNGYVVVHEAVPGENLVAVVDVIWDSPGKNPRDPQDWYRPPLRTSGMVEIYHHQALWNNRQHPRVYQAFVDLLGTERLWVGIDRASMKPPRHADHPEYDHSMVHWDIDMTALPFSLTVRPAVCIPDHPEYDWRGFIRHQSDTALRPPPFGLQGVLYLTDTAANQGGFHCVPGPPHAQFTNRDSADPSGLTVRPVAGKAGDLIIWDRRTAHGNGHNDSDQPRFAQYICMAPAPEDDEDHRLWRIELWKTRAHPPGFAGDPRRLEQQHGKTAELTPLGRKLLGLDQWQQAPACLSNTGTDIYLRPSLSFASSPASSTFEWLPLTGNLIPGGAASGYRGREVSLSSHSSAALHHPKTAQSAANENRRRPGARSRWCRR